MYRFQQMVFDMVTRSATDSCGPHGHYTHEALLTTNAIPPSVAHHLRGHYGTLGHTMAVHYVRWMKPYRHAERGSRSLAWHAMQRPVENCHSMMELPGNFEIASQ